MVALPLACRADSPSSKQTAEERRVAQQERHDEAVRFMDALSALALSLNDMSNELRAVLDRWGGFQNTQALMGALTDTYPFAQYALSSIPKPATKTGRPRNDVAYDIAELAAELYILAHEKRPGIGLSGDNPSILTGEYGKAVTALFALLKVELDDPAGVCRRVLKTQKDNPLRIENMSRVPPSHSLLTGKYKGPSLFDLAAIHSASSDPSEVT